MAVRLEIERALPALSLEDHCFLPRHSQSVKTIDLPEMEVSEEAVAAQKAAEAERRKLSIENETKAINENVVANGGYSTDLMAGDVAALDTRSFMVGLKFWNMLGEMLVFDGDGKCIYVLKEELR